MAKRIIVEGLQIAIDQINESDYISLTDIARRESEEPKDLIASWLKNSSTLLYLEAWERTNNPDFKGDQMTAFKLSSLENRVRLSPQKFIEATGAIGLVSKSGRHGGGTWAHKDIALNFCYWLSPPFQVYFIKEFQRLKEAEYSGKNLEWHVERVTDLLDEARNWMDSMPGQKPARNRLGKPN